MRNRSWLTIRRSIVGALAVSLVFTVVAPTAATANDAALSSVVGGAAEENLTNNEPPVAPGESNIGAFSEDTPPQLMNKTGGVTSTNPDDPSVTITEWPEEGVARVSNGPFTSAENNGARMASDTWYCEIKIPTPTLVVGGLQWGGSATCDGQHTPSWVHVSLEDTCTGAFCFAWETKRGPYRSSYSQDYSRLSSVSQVTPCDTSEERKIRAKVVLYVRDGVEQDTRTYPEWDFSCHIKN